MQDSQQELALSPIFKFAPAASSQEVYLRTGVEGTLTGTVRLVGDAPTRKRLDMSADPICPKINLVPILEDVVVTGGKLAHVFVYINGGGAVDRYEFGAPASEVELHRTGCQFAPRVLGLQVHQLLKVINDDPTTHNLRPTPRFNKEVNMAQTPGSLPLALRFNWPETMIPIKCNMHPWKRAWVGVLWHPFFATSDRDGSFKIEGLPPGDYELVAWHERLGQKTIQVSIGPNQSVTQEIIFFAEHKPRLEN
jgi:hypothetical protein